jgi:nucleoid-associated protein YgaU
MKMSYKIALLVSLAVCVMAVILFTGRTDTADTPTDTVAVADSTEAAPRSSLLSGTSRNGTTSPTATPPTNPTGRQTDKTLAQDVRSRIQAADKAEPSSADQSASTVPPTQSATPDAIALTRTAPDNSAKTDTPKTSTPPAISREALDAILGTTTEPPAATPAKQTIATGTDRADVSGTDSKTDSSAPFAGGTYTVQPGDTFSSIATKHYGDESRWFNIAQANPTTDPTRLRVGQELKLPAQRVLQEQTEPVPSGPEGVKTYAIRPGDSLSTVADTYYGDPTLWRVIYNYNRNDIGDNPNAIQAGMLIKVPPRVTGAR